MLAENLETWAEKERQKSWKDGQREGLQEGLHQRATQTAINLLKLGILSEEQIAQVTELPLAEVEALRSDQSH